MSEKRCPHREHAKLREEIPVELNHDIKLYVTIHSDLQLSAVLSSDGLLGEGSDAVYGHDTSIQLLIDCFVDDWGNEETSLEKLEGLRDHLNEAIKRIKE